MTKLSDRHRYLIIDIAVAVLALDVRFCTESTASPDGLSSMHLHFRAIDIILELGSKGGQYRDVVLTELQPLLLSIYGGKSIQNAIPLSLQSASVAVAVSRGTSSGTSLRISTAFIATIGVLQQGMTYLISTNDGLEAAWKQTKLACEKFLSELFKVRIFHCAFVISNTSSLLLLLVEM